MIVEEGHVRVLAPKDAELKRIQTFVKERHAWIIKRVVQQQKTIEANKKQYIAGEKFAYLGQLYPLALVESCIFKTCLHQGHLQVALMNTEHKEAVRQSLVYWYQQQAKTVISEKVARYEQKMGVHHTNIRFRDYKSRWGSCDNQGQLSFDWRLIMAPHVVIDYVVVHELCHLTHPNHSQAFWQEVCRFMPHYHQAKDWLKDNDGLLVV